MNSFIFYSSFFSGFHLRLSSYRPNFSQAHPWFRCIQWDRLYETEAAYKPTVTGDLDTQNFEKFPEVNALKFNMLLLGIVFVIGYAR